MDSFDSLFSDRPDVPCLLHIQHSLVDSAHLARHLDLLHPKDLVPGSLERPGESAKNLFPGLLLTIFHSKICRKLSDGDVAINLICAVAVVYFFFVSLLSN